MVRGSSPAAGLWVGKERDGCMSFTRCKGLCKGDDVLNCDELYILVGICTHQACVTYLACITEWGDVGLCDAPCMVTPHRWRVCDSSLLEVCQRWELSIGVCYRQHCGQDEDGQERRGRSPYLCPSVLLRLRVDGLCPEAT